MKTSNDKQSLEIAIAGALSPTEVETLIADLAAARAHMLPPVPLEPPKPGGPNTPTPNISVQDDPYLQARRLNDGRIRLWVRNYGLGWLVFNIPIDKACTLRDYLVANTPEGTTKGASLFAQNHGDGDAFH